MEVIVHCREVRGKKMFGVSTIKNNVTGWESAADLARLSDLAIAQVDQDPAECEVGETFTVEVEEE